jgi:integrase
MFAEARDQSGLTWASDPPTFHEIRSLAARLYAKERGDDFAQALRGHKTGKCAAPSGSK